MGSTIYERLGPKPAKYSMGQALGDAIRGGGAYFGAVAVEKAKAEALQQARAAKLEDRDYAKSEKLADRDYAREVALTDQAREDSYRETPTQRRAGELQAKLDEVELGLAETPDNARLLNRQSDITKELELLKPKANSQVETHRREADIDLGYDAAGLQAKIDIERANGVTESLDDAASRDATELAESRNNEALEVAKTIQVKGKDLEQYGFAFGADEGINPSMVYDVDVNKQGDPVEGFRESPDYALLPDGTIGRLSGGRAGRTSESLKEGEMKFRIHAKTLSAARRELETILGGGYDTESSEAFRNRLAKDIPLGNYFQTDEGQAFEIASSRLAESLFKGESGAAGSDAEANRYRSFIPQAGDSASTIAMKMRILDVTEAAFSEAGKLGMTADEAVLEARVAATNAAMDYGFSPTKDGYQAPDINGGNEVVLERIRQRIANRKKGGS